jgi:hypothetical protein
MRIRLLLLCALFAACGPDFTPEEEVDRLRLFGVRLEVQDRPDSVVWPRVDEDLRLEALATTEAGLPDDLELAVRFCPLAFQTSGDLECVFDEESFEQVLLQAVPLPDDVEVDLDLNFDVPVLSSTTALFNLERQLLGEELRQALEDTGVDPTPLIEDGIAAFCEQIQTQEFSDAVTRPACDGTFEFRFDIVLTDGDERLRAVRQFAIIYDPTPPQLDGDAIRPNRNPRPSLLCARDDRAFERVRSALVDSGDLGNGTPITTGQVGGRCAFLEVLTDAMGDPTGNFGALPELDATLQTFSASVAIPLFFDSAYSLIVADLCGAFPATPIPERSSCSPDVDIIQPLEEGEVETPESLNLSWFADTPDLDATVTAFEFDNPDATSSEARVNVFETPRRIDFEAEDEPLPLELFVVVRDGLGRGGRAFLKGLYTLRPRPMGSADP